MTSPTDPRTHHLYHAASDSAFTALGGCVVLVLAMATLLVSATVAAQLTASTLVALSVGEAGLAAVAIAATVRTGRGLGALGLRRTAPLYVAAAVLIGASLWYLNWRLIQLVELPPHNVKWLERMADEDAALPQVLLVLAVLPALCEELVFRGVLVQALATRLVTPVAVIVSALLFSLYHLSLAQAIPTFTLGLVLGAIALRARSVLPTMIAHLLNNAFALLYDYHRLPWMAAHPSASLVISTVALATGLVLAVVPPAPSKLPSASARAGDQ